MPDALLLGGLAASTLLSEDAACVAAGLLVQGGRISPLQGVAACAAGIYAGDCLLWAAGRLLPRVGFMRRHLPHISLVARHVDSPCAILASRFVPGTRLPLYLAAGAVGRRPVAFFFWTFVAVLLWTPLLVLGTASSIVAGPALVGFVYATRRVEWRRLAARWAARLHRWRRWEFWPSFILYTPVVLHIARLAVRHGGLGTLTAANPGLPEGGFVGESKFDILGSLPARWTIPAVFVAPADPASRTAALRAEVERRGWTLPLILKPDAGQRGAGVRRVHGWSEVAGYLVAHPAPAIAQPYHPGPYEAGIFYYRRPGEARGRIFSITDKRFPEVIGDGESPLEDLIWSHRRCRLQAGVFLMRHAADRGRVLAAGERFRLALAGNHAQGTMFRDGAHLWTEALEHRIDEIARAVPGFHIGRFDVRYSSVERFRAGEDLAVVELNGVTSESTNIYDPAFTFFEACHVLCRQWTLVFEIGSANRARGHAPASAARLLRLSLDHLRAQPPLPLAS